MPTLSVFFGITIRMHPFDHEPPHFHAYYGEYHAQFTITPAALQKGSFPNRAAALVLEWAMAHQQELLADWDLAQQGLPLLRIDPLR